MKACLVRNHQSTLVNNSVHPFVIGVLHGRHVVRSNVDLEHWCVFFLGDGRCKWRFFDEIGWSVAEFGSDA